MSITIDFRSALLAYLIADTALKGQIGANGLYAGLAPQNVATPYVLYNFIGGMPDKTHDGNVELETRRIQFDVYADTTMICEQVADNLKRLLDCFKGIIGSVRIGSSFRMNEIDYYIDLPAVKRKLLDYKITFSEV